MLDISFIKFGILKVKLQLFFGDVSVLKVWKLIANFAIKEHVQLRFGVQKSPLFLEESSELEQTWQFCR